jgi:rRNA maturation RNase YbeY
MKIVNNQNRWRTDEAKLRALVDHLLDRAEGLARDSRPRELSVILMDDAGMTEVNEALLHHEGPTDVITVRYHAIPGEPEQGDVAELYVNVERAAELSRRGWPAGRELALYLAHGCDHLAGEDDATPTQRRRMRRRELKWLREAEKTGHALNAIMADTIDNQERHTP